MCYQLTVHWDMNLDSLVVVLRDASCELSGCEPLGNSCGSPKSFECL